MTGMAGSPERRWSARATGCSARTGSAAGGAQARTRQRSILPAKAYAAG